MTISTTTIRAEADCDGSTKTFPFTFPFLDKDDIIVLLVTDATGAEQILVLDTDYSLTDPSGSGGTVTTLATSAYSSAYRLVIYRNIDLTQETDLITGGALPAESVEDTFDRLVMQMQQIAEALGRSIQLNVGSEYEDIFLDDPESEKFLRYNTAADSIENVELAEVSDLVLARIGGNASGDIITTDDTQTMSNKSIKGNITIYSSYTGYPIVEIRNQNDNAESAELRGIKDSESPADGDRLFRITAHGDDDGGSSCLFAFIDFFSADVTDGDEAGGIKLSARIDNSLKELLTISGYNGTVGQGEIKLNAADEDVDTIVRANSTDALKVQGSDGAVSIPATLDLGSGTTKRAAPAGTFVNNANGNPNISDTLLSVHTQVVESTWESVGATGSGADNIWTALNSVPIDADWIEISIELIGTDGSASSPLLFTANARDSGSTECAAGDNYIAYARDYSDGSGNAYGADLNTRKIPVTNRVFEIFWISDFTTSYCYLVLVGWGFNPPA